MSAGSLYPDTAVISSLDQVGDVDYTPAPTSGDILRFDGANWVPTTLPAMLGDVVGPLSATNGNLAVYDGPSGKLIQDTGIASSDVSANTTHRSSDGTDHSDVVLNNTHRSSRGYPMLQEYIFDILWVFIGCINYPRVHIRIAFVSD